ncbi:ABC transporter permease [Draconibacterium sp. IB214405]|uniref:ABC transporter permease n=1 Tax=Draconibacterium sp. IB214405 TaxID=3097352 RepID=UPI002A0E2853|nr:ABC transporter permease [Draconibacterium sp. IB214405]MDX8337721.1 ABC transporter permease [Draconibacterium sp. IB214405]
MNLKVVFRNLLKHPFLNLVKVIGLSLALAGIIFISLFLKNELTYDSYQRKSAWTYRYTITDPDFFSGKHFARIINPGYVAEMSDALPELEDFVRLRPVRGGLMKYGDRYYKVNQAFECDSTFFNVFDAELLVGDKKTALENPASIVITESFAQTIFGKTNPIGEVLTLPSGQYYGENQDFTISGVMSNFPANSHIHPDFVATPVSDRFTYGWAWTYLVLAENTSVENVKAGIYNYLKNNEETNPEEMDTEVHLQKISDIHLNSHKLREIEENSNIRNVYVLAIAAIILLLISISNYANLNIGMAGFSAKYLFINKLLGSSRSAVVSYFFFEGLFIVIVTLLFTVVLSIPVNVVIARFFNLNLLKGNFVFTMLLIFGFCILTLGFGMLPVLKSVFAFVSTRFNRGSSQSFKRVGISRVLIVFQYAFSIALIVTVIVVSRQTNYALNSSLGVQEDNVICFESVHASIQQKFGVFKEQLLQYNSIESVSAMMEPPGGEANDMFPFEMEGYESENPDQGLDGIGVFPCDYSFASIFKLQFLAGTNFSENNNDNEGSGEYIINKAAMNRLHYSNPDEIVGKDFKLNFTSPGSGITIPKGKIIGVVEDFHLSSLRKEVEPLVLFKRDKLWLINFVVSFQPGMKDEALADMRKVWNDLFPEYPFKYEHVDAMYQKVYKAELLQARLLSVFTVIALFICSMGLFGLALIITQNRTKEIGVRKVNGARVSEILMLLNKDYIKWVAVAFVLACPAAWFAMEKWLVNFAYKTSLSWWIFVIAGIVASGIVLLTVSIQSWKAATRNPVEALRYE